MLRLSSVAFVLAAGLIASSAWAQSYDPYRGDRYDPRDRVNPYSRDNYRPSYGGGYDNGGAILDRTMADLQQAGSGYYARRQHRRIDHAMRELSKFGQKMSRGKFDRHPLDEAIGELSHLSGSRDLDPRSREILARDAGELRAFRSGGGYDYRR